MNEWQQSFLQKLEQTRKQWQHRFESFAAEYIEGVFGEFDDFTTTHGFRTTTPSCHPGTRLFKFELTENGYLLLAFHMEGLDGVASRTEVFVPGPERVEPAVAQQKLSDANEAWVRLQFQRALDRFITAFGAAGALSHAETA